MDSKGYSDFHIDKVIARVGWDSSIVTKAVSRLWSVEHRLRLYRTYAKSVISYCSKAI
jgi:hypothetical protein